MDCAMVEVVIHAGSGGTMNARISKSDALLDAALEMTFPASDPIAVDPLIARQRTTAPGAPRRSREKKPAGRSRAAAPGARE